MSSSVKDNSAGTKGPLNPPLEDPRGSSDPSLEEAPVKGEVEGSEVTFPEGGMRAWSVAIGCSLVLFATFGYVNAFG